ncbi:putative ribonuclease H-like domain-containing protein [Tanacetum coccineum]
MPSSEPTLSYFDDFDYLKYFKNEFPAIAYNDALTSKLDFSKPTVSPQHVDELDKTSLSEYDDEEQNVIYFNDLFPFNVIYPNDLSDKDNDNDKIDIEQFSGDLSIEPLPTVIKIDAQWLNKLLETTGVSTAQRLQRKYAKCLLLLVQVCNASQPNSPQLVHEDLQQIHPDDMEEMDLRWQMAMLTMRARRFLKNTGRKLTVNGNETVGFDSPKWLVLQLPKEGHFDLGVVELQEIKINKEQRKVKRSVPPMWATSTSTALVSCDGLGGYDWSDQAEEGPNYALMAFSSLIPDSEVSNDSICSKSCLETVELLKSQNDQLLKDLKKSELMVLGEITIRELRKKLEIVQKEKDGIQLNVDKFEHASKSLNKLIECQIVDNCKKGLGYENYNAVPPPYTGNFMPPTPDLSFTGLDEFVNEPVVENCKAMSSEEEPKVVRKYDDAPSIEEWVSDDEEEDVSQPKTEKKIVRPSIVKKEFVKSKQQEKTARKTVKQVVRNIEITLNLVERAVLMTSGLVSINIARQNISKTAVLVNTARQVNATHSNNCVNAAKTIINNVNAASTNKVNAVGGKISIELPFDPNRHALEDYSIFDFSRDDGVMADMNNLDTTIQVNPIPTTIIHKDHPHDQVIKDLQSATQTKKMSKNLKEHGRTQKGNSCIEGSKLDRGYAGRASTIQVTRSLDFKGINYDEVFAPVARIEAIRLFLAYASFKDFVVYQMDVKSAFLYGKIEEEVYVCQPPGFEDPDFPDRVYKVEKALYGLHQAPRAWYETLSTYLLDNGFQRGKIDKTLFIKRHKGDILLMSSMGELTFFLGLQVKQKKDGIFISQDKYVDEILKKFGFTEVKTASTPMETQKPLLKDEDGEEVDVHMYRSMIGSLMYLTSSRPDIMFAVCACARYQVNPKVSHLHAVKRIFRYLKGQLKLGLWYPKDSPFVNTLIVIMLDASFGYDVYNKEEKQRKDGKKIIITESSVRRDLQLEDEEGIDCLPNSTIFEQLTLTGNQSQMGKGSAIPTDPHHTPTFIQPSTQPQKTQKPRKPKRKDTQVPQPSDPIGSVVDEAVHKELGNGLVRAATTTSSLEAEQDSGGGPRCQETMGDTIAQTRFENVSKHSNDSLLARESLMMKKAWVSAAGDIVSAASAATTVSTATTTTATITTVDDINLAQALKEMKSTKPKKKGIVIQEAG